ncbi:MAG: tetratricopeptide repeat protein, partial [Candidatus Lokiarchaeia archaeon]
MKKTAVWMACFSLSISILIGCNKRPPKLIELENQYRSHPDDSYTKLKLAIGYAFFGKNIEDFEKGINIFEEYLKDNPRDSKAHVFYGMTLIKMSEYEKNDFDKLAWLKKGLNQMDFTEEMFPNEILIYLVRGMASLNIPEDYIKENQRISDFEKALAILN